jgi:hypothetical protein
MIVVAIVATLVIASLLLVLTQPVQAYSVRVSGLPDPIPLDKETTIVITVDLEGAQSIPIKKIDIILSDPDQGIMANGSFYANGTIIDDGGFIISVSVTDGTINHGWGYDSTTGIVYSVVILLKSSDFQQSKGNEFTAIVDRGPGLSPLRSPSETFDIGGEIPWLMIILVIVVVDVIIIVGVWYYLRNRRK